MTIVRQPLLGLVALVALTAPAQAGEFQDTALLDTAVAQFTGHATGEEGGARTAIDTRLKLAACAMPQFSWRGSYHDSVVVRCMAPAWQIYVPVRNTAPARPTLAAAGAISPGAPAPKPVDVIKRGDPVTIEAASEGFSITRDGIAMGDAAVGGRLMVKVEERQPPIQAVAVEPGRVTLPGWSD